MLRMGCGMRLQPPRVEDTCYTRDSTQFEFEEWRRKHCSQDDCNVVTRTFQNETVYASSAHRTVDRRQKTRDSHTFEKLNWRRSLASIVNGPHQYSGSRVGNNDMHMSGVWVCAMWWLMNLLPFDGGFVSRVLCSAHTAHNEWKKNWIVWRVNASGCKRNEWKTIIELNWMPLRAQCIG